VGKKRTKKKKGSKKNPNRYTNTKEDKKEANEKKYGRKKLGKVQGHCAKGGRTSTMTGGSPKGIPCAKDKPHVGGEGGLKRTSTGGRRLQSQMAREVATNCNTRRRKVKNQRDGLPVSNHKEKAEDSGGKRTGGLGDHDPAGVGRVPRVHGTSGEKKKRIPLLGTLRPKLRGNVPGATQQKLTNHVYIQEKKDSQSGPEKEMQRRKTTDDASRPKKLLGKKKNWWGGKTSILIITQAEQGEKINTRQVVSH